MNVHSIDAGVTQAALDALNKRRAAARRTAAPAEWAFQSPKLAAVLELARRYAAVPTTPIVIQAERGSGAQALARLIHDADPISRGGRFRVVPAAFVSAGELRGWLLTGTLVIEDFENLKGVGQAWVAETLAGRGAGRPGLRIIATSRWSVPELAQRRHLSQELLGALDVFRLVVPPLRERADEIVPAAEALLQHHGVAAGRLGLRLSPAAAQRLTAHSFPANVAELRNVVERAVALAGTPADGLVPPEAIVFHDEPAERPGTVVRAVAPVLSGRTFPSLIEVEREYLTTLIRALNGRRTEIARVMGISYPTVLKKIARHRLDVRALVGAGGEGAGA
ncbi:MAG TPA: helix-turn-helix domain-containing protein [Polyangia bacterium]|nr:helix-turn-helix domain-containing protein [Polyangia bacterium]